ncbi:MAG: ybjI [Bacillota bacterium]|nr:ybjI [Bacillota bacterium]
MNKIYISDLDGTLLNEKANLSFYSKKELNRLIEEHNINFTVATARNVYSIKEMFKDVNLKLPVIEFNGSFITDIKTGEKLIVNNIDKNVSEQLLKLCTSYGQFPMISSFNGSDTNLYYKSNVSEGMDLYLKDRREVNPNSLTDANLNNNYINEKSVCFTLINKKEYLDDLINEIKNTCGNFLSIYYSKDIYYTDWYWASIYSVDAKKGVAIKKLMDYLNINDHYLTVFGDHHNDVDMFNVADKSIAVGNAQQELLGHADMIIGTNKEDSVIKYIKKDIEKFNYNEIGESDQLVENM